MANKPKISVVIPVYNTEQYLRQCLDSIMAQTFQDFEIICVDDYSNDSSWGILKEFDAKYSRMRCVKNNKNMGAAYCRNLGIKLARGEYLAILDSDDYFAEEMLEISYCEAKKNDADLVYWEYNSVDTKNNAFAKVTRKKAPIRKIMPDIFCANDIADYVFDILKEAPWTKLYKREFVLSANVLFQNIENSNDVFFGCMISLLANKIIFLDNYFVYHRIHRSGQISCNRGSKPMCAYQAMHALLKCLREKGLYHVYRRAFCSYFIGIVAHAFSAAGTSEEIREVFTSFLNRQGWDECDMLNLHLDDFRSPLEYFTWKAFVLDKDWEKGIGCDIDMMFNKNLFFQLSSLKNTYCLWGYGKRGKKFVEAAIEYGFLLSGIIDSNEAMDGYRIGRYDIHPLNKQKNSFDAVILTNSTFYADVREQLDRAGYSKSKIIDIDCFIRYGMPIQACID